ncbi:hypothetical protein BDV93DRAFT_473394, partial [Ceratobasidium sp. AG-I]
MQAKAVAIDLEVSAKLHRPLPVHTDFTEAEDNEIQSQVREIHSLPKDIARAVWIRFGGRNLVSISRALHSMSLSSQPKAFATYVQILSLLPDPMEFPNFRVFLRGHNSNGLANIIGAAFIANLHWRLPSGPGDICNLLIHLLMWNDPNLGDDKKSCMDYSIRRGVQRKIRALKSRNMFFYFNEHQGAGLCRLDGVLMAIQNYPEATYLERVQDNQNVDMFVCGNQECDREPTLRCKKCMLALYCGDACQSAHWREHCVECL